MDRQREARLGGSHPRGNLGLHHRGGQGSGAEGLRRDPVRLRALPHRRQARRRAVLEADQRRRSRAPAIAGFLAKARELGPTGVFIAADVFGYTAFNANDTDIGQRIEDISAQHLDYFSPDGLPVRLSHGDPGLPQPGEPLLRDRPGERAAHPQAHGGPAGPGPAVAAGLQGLRLRQAHLRPRRIQAQVRGAEEAAPPAGCSGIRRTTTRRRPSAPRPPPSPSRPSSQARRRCRPSLAVALAAPCWLGAQAAGAGDPPSNELGRVMILEYHKIDLPEERWTRTPGQLPARPPAPLGARLSAGRPERLPRRPIALPKGTTPRDPHLRRLLARVSSATSRRRTARLGGRPRLRGGHPRGVRARAPGLRPRRDLLRAAGGEPAEPALQSARSGGQEARSISSRGFEIGNHTLWHANLAVRRGDRAQAAPEAQEWVQSTSPAIASARSRFRWAPTRRSSAGPSRAGQRQHLPPRRHPDGGGRRRALTARADLTPITCRASRPPRPTSGTGSATSTSGGERYMSDGDPATVTVPRGQTGQVGRRARRPRGRAAIGRPRSVDEVRRAALEKARAVGVGPAPGCA